MASNYEELEEQLEQLQLDYDEKCNELAERENELRAANIKIQELQILLGSQAGQPCSSAVPLTIAAGISDVAGNPQAEELRRMFLWLAEQVELEGPIHFDASSHNLTVAGREVPMGNIVQWRLKQTDLRLSVPSELASEVSNLLSATKMNPKTMCETKAKAVLDSWLLTSGEAPSETTSAVTLLTHRVSQVTCIVANFPVPHVCQESPGFRVGDFVEVNFEGQWFRGVVKHAANGDASVQCDVDPLGVLTTAPMGLLRRPVDPAAPQPTPEAPNTPAIPESPQPQPQVTSNRSGPQSPQAQHKTAFSHSRAFSCP